MESLVYCIRLSPLSSATAFHLKKHAQPLRPLELLHSPINRFLSALLCLLLSSAQELGADANAWVIRYKGVIVEEKAQEKLTLHWSDNSDNEDGFQIERSTDGVSFALIATVARNVTTFTDTIEGRSTDYWYRVNAYNQSGKSGYAGPLLLPLKQRSQITRSTHRTSDIAANEQYGVPKITHDLRENQALYSFSQTLPPNTSNVSYTLLVSDDLIHWKEIFNTSETTEGIADPFKFLLEVSSSLANRFFKLETSIEKLDTASSN